MQVKGKWKYLLYLLIFLMLLAIPINVFADSTTENSANVYKKRLKHGPNNNKNWNWSVSVTDTHDSYWSAKWLQRKNKKSSEPTWLFEYSQRVDLTKQAYESYSKNNGYLDYVTPEFKVIIQLPNGEVKEQYYGKNNLGKNYKSFRPWNGYQSFRSVYQKLLNQGYSVSQAIKDAEDYLSSTWVEKALSVQYDEDAMYPVGTKFTFINTSDISESTGTFKASKIQESDWQVYERDIAFVKRKNHVLDKNPWEKGKSKKSMPLQFTVTAEKPGYFEVYLNAADNARGFDPSTGKEVWMNNYGDTGDWQTPGGDTTYYAESGSNDYDPWAINWYYRHAIFKIIDDKANLKVAHWPLSRTIKTKPGSNFRGIEVKEWDPETGQTVGGVINNQNCNFGGRHMYGDAEFCGYLEEGKTYRIKNVVQRDIGYPLPEDHDFTMDDIGATITAGFNIEQNYIGQEYWGYAINRPSGEYAKDLQYQPGRRVGGWIYKKPTNGQAEQFIDFANSAEEYEKVAPTIKLDVGNTTIVENFIKVPVNSSDYNPTEDGWRPHVTSENIFGKWKNEKGIDAYPTLTIFGYLNFNDKPFTDEQKKEMNIDTSDDWNKTILLVTPGKVDNETKIIGVNPKDPGTPDPEKPHIPIDPDNPNTPVPDSTVAANKDTCVELNSTDGDLYDAYIRVKRLTGEGEELVNPTINVNIVKNGKTTPAQAHLVGNNNKLSKVGDSIYYVVKDIEIKSGEQVIVQAGFPYKDANLANNADDACFQKNPEKPVDNQITIVELIPEGGNEDNSVLAFDGACNTIDIDQKYSAKILVSRITGIGNELIRPSIKVFISTEPGGKNKKEYTARLVDSNNEGKLMKVGDEIEYRVDGISSNSGNLFIDAQLPYEDMNLDNNYDSACFKASLDISVTEFQTNTNAKLDCKGGTCNCENVDVKFGATFQYISSAVDEIDTTIAYPVVIQRMNNGKPTGKTLYSGSVKFDSQGYASLVGEFRDNICDPNVYDYVIAINGGSTKIPLGRRVKKEISSEDGDNGLIYDNNINFSSILVKGDTDNMKPCTISTETLTTNRPFISNKWSQEFENVWFKHYIKEEKCCKRRKNGKRRCWCCGAYLANKSSQLGSIPSRETRNYEERYKIRILYQDTNTVRRLGADKWIDISDKTVITKAGQWFDIRIQSNYQQNRSKDYAFAVRQTPFRYYTHKTDWSVSCGNAGKYHEFRTTYPKTLSEGFLTSESHMFIDTILTANGKQIKNQYVQEPVEEKLGSYVPRMTAANEYLSGGAYKNYKIPNTKGVQARLSDDTRKKISTNAKDLTYQIKAYNFPFQGYSKAWDHNHPGFEQAGGYVWGGRGHIYLKYTYDLNPLHDLTFNGININNSSRTKEELRKLGWIIDFDNQGNMTVCDHINNKAVFKAEVNATIKVKDQLGIDTQIIGN